MRDTEQLAQFYLAFGDDQSQSITGQAIESCLRFLQNQAEVAGMPMTAHLISTAALAALEEYLPVRDRLTN